MDLASNGLQALAMASPYYNLIILDIGLPDIIGIELAKTLKQRFQNQCPPMVAVTALSSDQLIDDSRGVGIKKIFSKPIDLEIFKAILSDNDLFKNNTGLGLIG